MTEAEVLARKRKVRGAHRSSATRMMGQAEALMLVVPVDFDGLVLLRTSLASKLKTIEELDLELISLTPEDQLEEEVGRADEYAYKLQGVLLQIDKSLKARTTPPHDGIATGPRPSPPAHDLAAVVDGTGRGTPIGDGIPRDGRSPSHSESGTSHVTDLAISRVPDRIKLPKINLPRFQGDMLKWTAFWDSFNSAVHLNDHLPDIDKFNYLRSLLEGSAQDAIAGLALTSANYGEAVEILKRRFGNKQLIVSKHMESLLSISAVASDQHLGDLRKLYDQAETNIRSLKALGVETDSYGPMLAAVLLNKLPRELRLIVSRKVASDDLKIEILLQLFEEELSARERAHLSGAITQSRRHQGPGGGSAPTSAFVAPSTRSGSSVCAFCQQSHLENKCNVVIDPKSRQEILRKAGRCFNCLRRNHISRNCQSKNRCKQCRGKHHTSICTKEFKPQDGGHVPEPTGGTSTLNPEATSFRTDSTTSTLCSSPGRVSIILLQTAQTVIYNPTEPTRRMKVRILFDSGSQKSYLTERVRSLLKLESFETQTLSISTFGAAKDRAQICPVVSVGICLKGYPDDAVSLHVVPTICEPLAFQPVKDSVGAYSHLKGLDLADATEDTEGLPIDVLVGCDLYWEFITGTVRRGQNGPVAIQTRLGWVLSGATIPVKRDTRSLTCNVVTHTLRVDDQPTPGPEQLEEQLRAFWELESLGIQDPERTLYDDFTDTVEFKNGRYSVRLPWKEFHAPLKDNYLLSLRRLDRLMRRLRLNPELLKQYNSTIQEQLIRGIVEAVPAGEEVIHPIHYLPHHGVLREDKATTKLRVVYDASAKHTGPSLNECLYKGPKFEQLIFDLLVRFRAYKVALIADLEKAFLMIEVDKRDRDVLRFLWVDDLTKSEPDLQILRFTRVVFGVSASPFLLNATVKHHLHKFLESNEAVVRRLLQSTYVDDIISGADTEEDALVLYAQAKEIFRQAGFNLRKFMSNSRNVQQKIDTAEGTSGINQGMSSARTEEVKVLGVTWNSTSDSLIFDLAQLSVAAGTLQPTKRNVVSLVGQFYDPLGFLAPVTIRFKTLFQKLCQRKLEWDNDLPDELMREWKSLLTDLKEAIPISIPRSYHHRESTHTVPHTLCGFCDASTKAYAAVVYLVRRLGSNIEVEFIASKTRVAPLKPQTIPRLELLSAFLLAKLITSISTILSPVLPLDSLECYTDSRVALCWIQGVAREWKPFVNNRVKEIRERVPPDRWRHCPGITNPADLPSRGLTPVELAQSELWRQGPTWLLSGLVPQSSAHGESGMPDECVRELKELQAHSMAVSVTSNRADIRALIDPCDYSTFTRLIGITAAIIRAVRLFRNSQCDDSQRRSTEERQAAETLWVMSTQRTIVDLNTMKKQFDLFLDTEGLWRCGGRLTNAEIPYSAKCPILLPGGHPITTLIIRQAHERVMHNGVKETLAEVRERYWIPRGRSVVRKLIHQCVVCRKFEGIPFKTPPPPPLPPCRVRKAPAFSYTGVDFAGPLLVRGFHHQHTSVKAWIALFTCYVTRAVHLDTVQDQSTPTFIRCLKRFVARRGLPRRFISDNGKTFKAASNYLKMVCQEESVQKHLQNIGVTWQFNVERAPWWGGAFERMVKSAKRCLRKVIGRAHFTLDELTTTLAEIEAVLNSRPLSYVSSDDLEEPITPAHLMLGRRILSLPDDCDHMCDLEDPEFQLDKGRAGDRVKHLNNVLNHFWKRWQAEYLCQLRDVHAYHARSTPNERGPGISVGDVVIVKDEQLPRGHWKLGIVDEVISGRDGVVRAATVRVATSSDRQQSLIKRPIQLLYPLEIHCETVDSPESSSSVTGTLEDTPRQLSSPIQPVASCLSRPKRAAAQRGEELRRQWIEQLTKVN